MKILGNHILDYAAACGPLSYKTYAIFSGNVAYRKRRNIGDTKNLAIW